MVPYWKMFDCLFRNVSESLPEAKDFKDYKHVGVLYMIEGMMEWDQQADWCHVSRSANAVRTVAIKRLLSVKAMLSIYKLSFSLPQSRSAALSCWEEWAKLVRAVDMDSSWMPSCGGIPATPKWEETTGHTQTMLEGLHMSFGLGITHESPRKEVEDVARIIYGLPCLACCHPDRDWAQ